MANIDDEANIIFYTRMSDSVLVAVAVLPLLSLFVYYSLQMYERCSAEGWAAPAGLRADFSFLTSAFKGTEEQRKMDIDEEENIKAGVNNKV